MGLQILDHESESHLGLVEVMLNCSFRRKVIFFVVFIAFCFIFLYCKISKNKEHIASKSQVVLQVATDTPFVPFEFVENGKIVGIDIDILNEISKKTGLKFKINEMAFSSIIASLNSKKVDMAIAGMGITEERKKQVDFTSTYFDANFALLSKNGSSFKKLDDLIDKIVVVQTGTTMYDFLVNYNKTHPLDRQINIHSLDSNAIGIEMLIRGKADALLAEEMQGKAYAKMYKNLTYSKIYSDNSGYAIALQKKSPYKKVINDAVKELKKDGTIDRIIEKWEQRYIDETIKKNKKQEYVNALFFILKGSLVTAQYAISSIICGVIIGLFFTLLMYSGSKILFWFVRIYVSVIRGTPMLLQMSFVYFGLSNIIGVDLSVFTSAVIALSFNSAGYIIEIVRSGIQSMDKGQFEACKSLNLSKYQAIKDIYIPQIVNNIFPALINEFISLIKESSIVSIFGGYEIMKRTNIIVAEYYSYFIPLIVAGLSYYIMTFMLEILAHWWEKKYSYSS